MEELLKVVEERLKENFGDAILSAEMMRDFPVFTIKRDKIVEVIKYLYDEPEMEFRFLTDLCGIHFPAPQPPEGGGSSGELGVIYHLHNMPKNWRIRLRIFFSVDDAVVPTLTTVFSAANWMERETYDFFGIVFKGHPNMKRILNVDEMIGFPLRKEFPLEDQTREDKNDDMFGR